MPALALFLVSRQFYMEVKDLLFSIVPFKIDVRKDGTFMCGRRLLEPRRADGSAHFLADEADEAKQRFLKYFDFSAVKQYQVDILIENCPNGLIHPTWDEEVELYDIRGACIYFNQARSLTLLDYISVVVSGVLAKSNNLCKLQVHLCLADFDWTHKQTLANTKLIVGPFESLRNVRQPQISGVYMGKPYHNQMLIARRPFHSANQAPNCSVPPLPKYAPLLMPGMPDFDAYASDWARWISAKSASMVVNKPPIKSMFTVFKDFYSDLASVVPAVCQLTGRQAFLHRARVAREQEDVEAFRDLRNELIQYWYAYLEEQERKKEQLNERMSRMLDSDVYPAHEWEPSPASSHPSSSTTAGSSSKDPVVLNPDVLAKEGIPMAANPQNLDQQPYGLTLPGWQETMTAAQLDLQPQPQSQAAQPREAQQQASILNQALANVGTAQGQPRPVWAQTSSASFLPTNHYRNIPPPTTTIDEIYANPTSFTPYELDFVDVGCYAHVGLSEDWYAEAGPSERPKRRVDSGFYEGMSEETVEEVGHDEHPEQEAEIEYVGKGKGRMDVVGGNGKGHGVEVICID